jgi:hypothetical protein
MSETKIATEHAARTEHGTGPEYESKLQLATRLGVSTRTIDNLMTRGLNTPCTEARPSACYTNAPSRAHLGAARSDV